MVAIAGPVAAPIGRATSEYSCASARGITIPQRIETIDAIVISGPREIIAAVERSVRKLALIG